MRHLTILRHLLSQTHALTLDALKLNQIKSPSSPLLLTLMNTEAWHRHTGPLLPTKAIHPGPAPNSDSWGGGRTFGPPWGSVSPSLPGSQTVHLQRHALEPGTWGTGRGQRAGRDMWRTKEPGPPPRASDPSRRPQSHWPWGQRTPIPMRPWEEEIPNPISFWEAGT